MKDDDLALRIDNKEGFLSYMLIIVVVKSVGLLFVKVNIKIILLHFN